MPSRRVRRAAAEARDGVRPTDVARDAEESLVGALEESNTAVETLHDADVDSRSRFTRARELGVAALFLLALAMFLKRRRG